MYTDAGAPGLYFLRAEYYDQNTGVREEAGLVETEIAIGVMVPFT